jgi:cytochrome b involved in lipid metabolism
MLKSFSQSDVASHNKTSDLYIIVDEDVYDLTKFQDEHPGIFIYLVQHDRLRLTYHRWQER